MIPSGSRRPRPRAARSFRPLRAGRAAVALAGVALAGLVGTGLVIGPYLAPARALAAPVPLPRPEAAPPKVLSLADARLLRRILDRARKAGWNAAMPMLVDVKDPTAAQIIRWRYLLDRGAGAPFDDLAGFISAAPDWPDIRLLRERAEEAMPFGIAPEMVVDWFTAHEPVTGDGALRLAEAYFALGQTRNAKDHLIEAWMDATLSIEAERLARSRYGKYLTRDHHGQRLDRLIWAGQTTSAQRMLSLVDKDQAALARARLALRRNTRGVDGAISAVPDSLQTDPGLLYERVRWRRVRGRHKDTWPLLLQVPGTAEGMGDPSRWYYERRRQAIEALQADRPDLAYRFLKAHGFERGGSFAFCEARAGWIALRYLGDAPAALQHFARMTKEVSRPISLGRGLYWQGRAAEAMGRKDMAQSLYELASTHNTTFYGQLAAERAGGVFADLSLPATTRPSPQTVAAFRKAPLTRAALVASDFASDYVVSRFLRQLVRVDPSPERHALVAQLAREMGLPHWSVRTGKLATYENHPATDYAYPVFDLPPYQGKDEEPEPALTHAIIRQESEFNPAAISHARAHGLMQVLPATARRTAQAHGLAYNQAWLTERPDYNTQVGRAYLGDLIRRYGGSYVLAAAAYNAGPTRITRWLEEFGDPRDPAVDAVDWIETIPFRETRNYVQRVLEMTQIYRARLSGRPARITLSRDLKRGIGAHILSAPDLLAGDEGDGTIEPGLPDDAPPASITPAPATPSDRRPIPPRLIGAPAQAALSAVPAATLAPPAEEVAGADVKVRLADREGAHEAGAIVPAAPRPVPRARVETQSPPKPVASPIRSRVTRRGPRPAPRPEPGDPPPHSD